MNVDMQLDGADGLRTELNELAELFGGADNTYTVATDVEYAVYQEFGTIHHPAQPHVRPAVQRGPRYMQRNAGTVSSVDELLNRTAQDILQEVKRRAPVDTGRLRDSYRIEVG